MGMEDTGRRRKEVRNRSGEIRREKKVWNRIWRGEGREKGRKEEVEGIIKRKDRG